MPLLRFNVIALGKYGSPILRDGTLVVIWHIFHGAVGHVRVQRLYAFTTGSDVHSHDTRGRNNYRTGRHRTVAYERLPSHAGVQFVNIEAVWLTCLTVVAIVIVNRCVFKVTTSISVLQSYRIHFRPDTVACLVYSSNPHTNVLEGIVSSTVDRLPVTVTCLVYSSNPHTNVIESIVNYSIVDRLPVTVTCLVYSSNPHTNVLEGVTREGSARPAVLVDDKLLEESDSIKFLGMYLDRGLTRDIHVESVCSRVTSGHALRNLAKHCSHDILRMALFTRTLHIDELGLLTLPCLYIFEVAVFCKSKGTLAQGRNIHQYETRGRDNYRSQLHRTVALINRLPEDLKTLADTKKFKSRLKRLLVSGAFYTVGIINSAVDRLPITVTCLVYTSNPHTNVLEGIFISTVDRLPVTVTCLVYSSNPHTNVLEGIFSSTVDRLPVTVTCLVYSSNPHTNVLEGIVSSTVDRLPVTVTCLVYSSNPHTNVLEGIVSSTVDRLPVTVTCLVYSSNPHTNVLEGIYSIVDRLPVTVTCLVYSSNPHTNVLEGIVNSTADRLPVTVTCLVYSSNPHTNVLEGIFNSRRQIASHCHLPCTSNPHTNVLEGIVSSTVDRLPVTVTCLVYSSNPHTNVLEDRLPVTVTCLVYSSNPHTNVLESIVNYSIVDRLPVTVTCLVYSSNPHTNVLEGVTREGSARPAVLVDDKLLEESDSIKFLGMYLDRGLTRDIHVESVCSRVTSDVFSELGLLTLPCLYIFEVAVFCKSKGTLAQGRNIHQYETRGRDNYRSQLHRTVASHNFPSQAGAQNGENLCRRRGPVLKKPLQNDCVYRQCGPIRMREAQVDSGD
ncbi:hypothetical protein J6590_024039 [Homalodisca vitripennis]|nr:hypothetical protein J6590_024039 [Homalodisca vitripennis]